MDSFEYNVENTFVDNFVENEGQFVDNLWTICGQYVESFTNNFVDNFSNIFGVTSLIFVNNCATF